MSLFQKCLQHIALLEFGGKRAAQGEYRSHTHTHTKCVHKAALQLNDITRNPMSFN